LPLFQGKKYQHPEEHELIAMGYFEDIERSEAQEKVARLSKRFSEAAWPF
jgi:hypothetical protein